ncbi:hypothetical protein FHE66_14625 [Georgenia sp. 311]|uniref:3'-5' exonuclease n=1 Tax=Georgenia sp. 311 TaxID=2585134 RepID=UPI00111211F4|nr:3'-5' exonuclease [Georgenia sp. 311]TNC16608.1 hypothetical protein FHE66_14625 [Georgenia sp. 311]
MRTEEIVSALAEALASAGGRVIAPGTSEEPDVVVLHPDEGLIGICVDAGEDVTDQTPFVTLNQRVHGLRQTLSLDASVRVARVVLRPATVLDAPHIGIGGRITISPAQLNDATWLDAVPASPLDPEIEEIVVRALFPEIVFTSIFRDNSHDAGAEERASFRYVLDAQQAHIAQRDGTEVAVIQGPPGSGKSLVLAARARWLAERHPDWRIRVLCYNRALVPYLASLTEGHPSITVSLFTAFAQDLGVKFSFENDHYTYHWLDKAMNAKAGVSPIADAVLVDEVQDFRPSWLAVVRAGIVKGRGGLFMAGDEAQALYHDESFTDAFSSTHIEYFTLSKPYRSTRNILEAVGGINGAFSVPGRDEAPEGEPVELIWADSWDEQAEAIGWEVATMLRDGDRLPQDIGILVTRRSGTFSRLTKVLEAHSVPHTVVNRENAHTFDRSHNAVKLMTVHSAKGHEFPVVFLFGLEALPSFEPDDIESLRRARVAFVGATRAKDQLMITYTRDNDYLRILSKDEANVRRWLWPDNYEVGN